MIVAQPGAGFEARVDGFPTGLAGTVGVQILDNQGGVTTARATGGILENPAGSGSYVAALTAPVDGGQYALFWDTGLVSPATTATEDLLVTAVTVPAAAPDMTPTLATVGALIRTRTTPRGATSELGTFTADTRPTGAQVTDLIAKAVGKVIEKVGDDLPAQLLDPARETAALRAAMLVELSFFGDQITANRSPYNELKKLYEEALNDLVTAVNVLGADREVGTGDDLSSAGMPGFATPTDGGLIHAPGSELPQDGSSWMRW